jgi:hypothetical protein
LGFFLFWIKESSQNHHKKTRFFQKNLDISPEKAYFFIRERDYETITGGYFFVSTNRKKQSSREAVAQNYRVLG